MERVGEISKPHEHDALRSSHARAATPAAESLSPLLQLQQQAGNQAVQQLLRSGYIRAKLAISNPDDPEEREADNVAHTVTRSHVGAPASTPCSCSHDGEMCEECQQKQSQPAISRRASTPSSPAHVPRIVSDVLRSPGHPLDAPTRAFFEPRFGRDFSHVRIHTDSHAAESAGSINANAYTAGSDIVFAPGQYAPDSTPGRTLLAHELTHTLQQSSSKTLHRDSGEGEGSGSAEGSGDVPGFDAEAELSSVLEEIDKTAATDAEAVARHLRLKLLLLNAPRNWQSWDAFDEFHTACEADAVTEEKTLAVFGDPDLNDLQTETLPAFGDPQAGGQPQLVPEAFPQKWSEKLGKVLVLTGLTSDLPAAVKVQWQEMQESGKGVPIEILAHGLPVDFLNSLDLTAFFVANVIGLGVLWTAIPGGAVQPKPGSLIDFTARALNYLHAWNDADLAELWSRNAQILVEQVKNGEVSIDPAAFPLYMQKRTKGVPWEEIRSSHVPGFLVLPRPSKAVDPFFVEDYVTSVSSLIIFGRSWLHAQEVTKLGAQIIGEADSRIAGENPFIKVQHAGLWGHVQGFYSEALIGQFKYIWEHPLAYLGGIAKDVGKYAILEMIPIVNVITNIYLLGGAVLDVAGSLADLVSADREAQDAKTAVALQRAAAHKALALSSTARKVVDAAVTYAASKAAGKIIEKAKGTRDTPEEKVARPGEDPAKVADQVKEQKEKAEKKRSDEAASEADIAVLQARDPQLRQEAAVLQEEIKTPDNIENVLDPELAEKYDYQVVVEGAEKHTYYHKPKGGWCRASGIPICGYAFGPEVEQALETARQARRPSASGKQTEKVAEEFFGSRFERQERTFEGRVLEKRRLEGQVLKPGEGAKYGMSIADLATKEGPRVVVEVKNIDIAKNLKTQFVDLRGQVAKYLSNVPHPEKTKFWVWLDIRGQKLPAGGLLEIVQSVTEGTGHVFDEVYLHTEVGTLVYKT